VVDRLTVTVRFFAAARAAAGVDEDEITVEAPATVADALRAVVDRHGTGLADVLRRCSFLLDAVAVHGHQVALGDRAVLDVLPPFAGG